MTSDPQREQSWTTQKRGRPTQRWSGLTLRHRDRVPQDTSLNLPRVYALPHLRLRSSKHHQTLSNRTQDTKAMDRLVLAQNSQTWRNYEASCRWSTSRRKQQRHQSRVRSKRILKRQLEKSRRLEEQKKPDKPRSLHDIWINYRTKIRWIQVM